MKTAEEIATPFVIKYGVGQGGVFFENALQKLINEARKEALEEAAEKAFDLIFNEAPPPRHIKELILSLINELK